MHETGIHAIKRQARLTVCKQRATGLRQRRKRTDRAHPA
jgi:hypothetical protein